MNVFDLVAVLTLDKSDYDSGLDEAEGEAQSFGSKLKSGLGTAGKVAGAAIGVVGAAATAISTKFVGGAKDVAAYGDNIDKMSQKMGISAQAYQEWDAIMQHSGTSIEALKPSMKTLAQAAVDGAEEFEKLGISLDEVQSMSQEDLFATVISRLQGMEQGAERTAITSKLLGRGATELGALLNTSAEETEAMRKRVHELGGVMSNEAVKASAGFQDSLQDMQTSLSGVKNNMMSNFLPALTTVMDGLTEIFAGNDETGIPAIEKGISEFADNMMQAMPRILAVGTSIIQSLISSIVSNAPLLIEAATTMILTLAQGMIENLPMLIEVALQILTTLAQGLSESLPVLIPTIVEVVLNIVDDLVNNVDLLIDAALQLMIGLANGLIQAIPVLIEKIPTIIGSLVSGLIKSAPKILEAGVELILSLIKGIVTTGAKLLTIGPELIANIWKGIKEGVTSALTWGKDLVTNFVDGIKSKFSAVGDAVKGLGSKIKDFLGFSEPDEGPLSDFHTYAPDMMRLFAQGIKDNENIVTDQLEKSFDFQDILGDNIGVDAIGSTTINHTGTIRLEGVNNQGEFIAASEYALEDIIVGILKRQARLA